MKPSEYNSVLNRIEYWRIKKHWSRYRLAKESGIPYSSFDNLYKRNSFPSISMLYKICNSVHITMSDFFQDELPFPPHNQSLIETIQALDDEQAEQLRLYADYLYSHQKSSK